MGPSPWLVLEVKSFGSLDHNQKLVMDHMGVSENSVPLHPMVLLIIIPILTGHFIGGIPHFQTYPYQSPSYKLVYKPH